MKRNIFLLLLIFLSGTGYSQNIAGFWYGSANVSNGGSANNYLIELILKQDNNTVQGVLNYYFRNTFRSVQLDGYYSSATRKLQLQSIPVTYFASTNSTEVDCIMNIIATLRIAKKSSVLSGTFSGTKDYRITCPEIFFSLTLDADNSKQDSVAIAIKQFKETNQTWMPETTDTLVATKVVQLPVVNYVIKKEYEKREKVVESEIVVDSDSIIVDFYDNGEIDGDSISVFFNDQLITFNRRLSTKSVQFKLGLDLTKEANEITMFADNLGTIPPNTALMQVNDGKKRYDIRLNSNLQRSATVRIKRKYPTGTTSTSGVNP